MRLTPAPRHYAWGRWLLMFVTVPVVLLTVRLFPEHRPDFFWHKLVIYGFCAAGRLQGLSVFGLLGGRQPVAITVTAVFFVASLAVAFLFFGPVLWLDLLGLSIFTWLMVGEYLDGPASASWSLALPGWLPRRVRQLFVKERALAEAVHGPMLLKKLRHGYTAEIIKDEWGQKGKLYRNPGCARPSGDGLA